MQADCFVKRHFIPVILLIALILIIGETVHSQAPIVWYYLWPNSIWSIPDSLWLIYLNSLDPHFDPYFNRINGRLLGYMTYTPFLDSDRSVVFGMLNIPSYPFFGSHYRNTFPYTTLSRTVVPYARFDYPAYGYGSPDFYVDWILLQ